MDLGILTLLSTLILSFIDVSEAAKLKGPNVCTQIQSVLHIDRIPTGGIMTKKIRYTTRCLSMIGQCSKYRIVYTPGYRENTKLTYRVAQVCCNGFVAQGKFCVTAPPPTPPKEPTVTNGATNAGTSVNNQGNIAGRAPFGPDQATGTGVGTGAGTHILPGTNAAPGTSATGTGFVATSGTATRTDTNINVNPRINDPRINEGHEGARGTGTYDGRHYDGSHNINPNGPGIKTGSGPWVGLGPRPGLPTVDRGKQRTSSNPAHPRYQGRNTPLHKDGQRSSHVEGVYPDTVDRSAADPDYSPRNYDPVMAFVSSATAAIGVLTLASTVLGIYLLHRRQRSATQGDDGSKPYQSFKLRALGSGKSVETKVEMQQLTDVKSSSGKEKGKHGGSRADCPYVDIEQMRNAGMAAHDGHDDKMPLVQTANTSENNSKGSALIMKKSRRNSGKNRSLPREPPTYAVVRKQKKDEERDSRNSRMAVSSICGDSSSLTASLDAPFTERESAHIYAQINRKSKGISTWSRSSSLPSRPTTMVSSNPDLQTSSSLRGFESFTKSLGKKFDVRRSSGHESSGYSSLQESKETLLYDTCSRKERMAKGGVAPAALYRSLKEKGLCGRTEYDKLSRCVKGSSDNDDSILRGYATLSVDTE